MGRIENDTKFDKKELLFILFAAPFLLPFSLGYNISSKAERESNMLKELNNISNSLDAKENNLTKDQLVKLIIKELTKKYNYNDEK